MSIGTLALALLGLLGALPMHATFGAVDFAGRSTPWWVPVIGLSVIAAAIAYVVGIAAARMLGPRLASFAGLTEVAFAVLFAWLMLGELPTAIQLVGGVFIVGGVILVRLDELRSAPPSSPSPSPPPPSSPPAGPPSPAREELITSSR
jgi:drug/metabolite transporter (DMT)-like permease